MQSSQGRLLVMWGHLALLAVIAAVVVVYLLDARATSLKVNNLLLVQPGSILALILVALVVPQCFKRIPLSEAEERKENLSDLGKVGALAAAFGAFVTTLEVVGFDVATFLFMVVGLFVCGERRWWLILVFSAVFTALLIYGYGAMIPFPFPLTVL
jgi:hypothetical protein